MGHEVAHALARHGAERVSQSIGAEVVGQILAAGVGIANPALAEDVAQLYGITASVGVILPWGRAQESEADRIGLILMAKTGYNPSSAVGFWERMSKIQQGGKPPEFHSSQRRDANQSDQAVVTRSPEVLPSKIVQRNSSITGRQEFSTSKLPLGANDPSSECGRQG